MKKALAKNIQVSQLKEIIKKFEEEEYIDIEVYEFDDSTPSKIIIRTSKYKDDNIPKPPPLPNNSIDNPKLPDNISYKDLLDNLN